MCLPRRNKQRSKPGCFYGAERTNEDNRDSSDGAYFVTLFAQLEHAVNKAYRQRVGDPRDTGFGYRLRLLGEMLFTPDEVELIADYYEIRCDIAHARVFPFDAIDVHRVYANILEFIGAMGR
ncbi:MAG: hypothetical protein WCK47_15225 [bacterium]